MRVIGITGMPGSGKSEAMQVARDRGHAVVRMGDLVWEEVERRGLPRTSEHVGRVANEMRQTHGMDVWARRTVERVRGLGGHSGQSGYGVVLIDGVRNMEEVETLRRELGQDFLLVAIHTDPEQRFRRMQVRSRADDSAELEVLRERDRREMGWGIARTIALADAMVVNSGSLDEFRAKVADLLDELARPAAGSGPVRPAP